ncbi:MAG: carboxypeptidase M32 [Spirochaetales bacterium]|nr:carboxypeptidase M32 [Spirochaetales bacterium]
MKESLNKLKDKTRELMVLSNIGSVLGWDQQTNLPEAGIAERAEQITLIQALHHDRITFPEIGELLEDLGCSDDAPGGTRDLDDVSRSYLRAVWREYSRAVKLPARLVTELARSASLSQAAWVKARQAKDYQAFAPHLDTLLKLNLEKARCLGYQDHPYDALLDEYEPWMKTADLRRVFRDLRTYLQGLLARISEAPQVDDVFLLKPYPVDRQEAFGRTVLADMGFDLSRGRMDVSAHPFTTSLGCDDVRITTRYNENFFKTSIFGIIHETGHALYELGYSQDIRGNILAQGASLGIHESQSRTWENLIGRSRAFWNHYLPRLKEYFPQQLSGIDMDDFYRGVNKVEPSLIRVEADEVTYNMHIILRFELETALLEGNLTVADLPLAWNDAMRDLLGVVPPSDAEGVLQDIHWSMGAFGYFPTYALGNLYGAQFFQRLRQEIPDLDRRIEQGDLGCILAWLRENIHVAGSSKTATELLKEVTGKELSVEPFSRYLEEKYSDVYELSGM